MKESQEKNTYAALLLLSRNPNKHSLKWKVIEVSVCLEKKH